MGANKGACPLMASRARPIRWRVETPNSAAMVHRAVPTKACPLKNEIAAAMAAKVAAVRLNCLEALIIRVSESNNVIFMTLCSPPE